MLSSISARSLLAIVVIAGFVVSGRHANAQCMGGPPPGQPLSGVPFNCVQLPTPVAADLVLGGSLSQSNLGGGKGTGSFTMQQIINTAGSTQYFPFSGGTLTGNLIAPSIYTSGNSSIGGTLGVTGNLTTNGNFLFGAPGSGSSSLSSMNTGDVFFNLAGASLFRINANSVPIIDVNGSLTGTTNIYNSLHLAPTATPGNNGFNMNDTWTGMASSFAMNVLQAVDSTATTGSGGATVLAINQISSSNTAMGPKNALTVNYTMTGSSGNGVVPGEQYSAAQFFASSNNNDNGTATGFGTEAAQTDGFLYGINPGVTLGANSTYWTEIDAAEFDVTAKTGSSVNIKNGISIVELSGDAVQGAWIDNALVFGGGTATQVSGKGWKNGIAFGNPQGYFSFDPAATLITAGPISAGTMNAANGIDLHRVTFSGNFLQSQGFSVDGAGNEAANTLTLTKGVIGGGVATNAALKALSITGLTAGVNIHRNGFTTAGDGGAADYTLSTSACSISGGDNGSQVAPTTGTGCWLIVPQAGYDVRIWGAVGNGVNDDTALLNTAFASGIGTILVPDKTFYSASGVTIPGNAHVEGTTYLSGGAVATGSTIQCALATTECVTVGSNNNTPNTIKNLIITRASGTLPSSNAECMKVNGGDGVTLEDISCYRHAEGFHVVGAASKGTILMANRIYTCAISDSHLIDDGWSVLRVNQSYFGCNGAYDVNGSSFIKVTGGDGTDGPNTLNVTNSQFNLGQNTVIDWLSFAALGTGQGTAIQGFEFYGNHIETAQNLIAADSSVSYITNFKIIGGGAAGGWGGGNHILALNASAGLDEWDISGVEFDGWTDLVMAPSSNLIQFVNWSDDVFQGNSIIVTSDSSANTFSFNNDTYYGSVTVTGPVQYAKFTGTPKTGTFTNSATGLVSSNLPNMQSTWTPSLTGSVTTGTTTYLTQYATFDNDFSKATVNFNIATSAALTGFSGNIGIGTLPHAAITGGLNQASCSVSGYTGITLTTGYTQVAMTIGSGSSAIGLVQSGSGVGQALLTAANFTGSAINISGTCTYRFQ